MKKRLVIWAVAVLALFSGWKLTPDLVHKSIPSIYYVTPSAQLYENMVQCGGTVYAVNQSRIVLDAPVTAVQVYAEIGDVLTQGDVIAEIQPAGAGFMDSLPQTLGLDAQSLESLLSVYGLTSMLEQAGLGSASGLADVMTETHTLEAGVVFPVSSAANQITAPISGVVTALSLTAGLTHTAGEAVATVADLSGYKVLAAVGESDISKIKLGDSAKVRGVAFGGKSYTGTVTKIYPTARRALSGTGSETVVDVEITLNHTDSSLKPGFSAKVEIMGGNRYQMMTVPYEAIRQDENNNEFVYTYENGRLKKSVVVTGMEMINEVEILDGLSPDSIVIFNPDDVEGEGAMIHIKGKADVH